MDARVQDAKNFEPPHMQCYPSYLELSEKSPNHWSLEEEKDEGIRNKGVA